MKRVEEKMWMKLHFQGSELSSGELGFERRLRQFARSKVLIVEQRVHCDDDQQSNNQIDIESERKVSAVTVHQGRIFLPPSRADRPKHSEVNHLVNAGERD